MPKILRETKKLLSTRRESMNILKQLSVIEKHLPLGTALTSLESAEVAFAIDSARKSATSIKEAECTL